MHAFFPAFRPPAGRYNPFTRKVLAATLRTMKSSPLRDLQDRLILKGWYPQSKLARWTVYLGLADLLIWLIRRGIKFFKPQSDFAGGWLTFLTYLVCILGAIWLLRWIRHKWMWRLRNRLLVTYVFIGVFPVVLIGMMLFLAGWLFVGQFAADLASKDLTMELRRLTAANHTLMGGAKTLVRTGRLEQDWKNIVDGEIATREFPKRQVTLWYRGKGYLLQGSPTDQPITVPDHAKYGFAAITLANNQIFLRSVSRQNVGTEELTLVSSIPLNREMLGNVAQNLGFLSVGPVPVGQTGKPAQRGSTINIQDGKEQTNFSFVEEPGGSGTALVEAGDVPTPAAWYDLKLSWGTFLSMTDWADGKSRAGFITVQTRLSQLYSRLFEAIGKNASIFITALTVIGVILLVIELIALFIGLRLTRTITRSVAELYKATEHINSGDFHHRIPVRSKDQLAALEGAFNSMTTSIEALIVEQKEKQKLEGELLIAQEVQALLFPAEMSYSESLEMHGICRPARTVSGDYYDFLQLGHNQIGLAVGDISGKGISAALLMATVHAFVRAYTIEEALTEAKVGAGMGTQLTFQPSGEHLPPATLLALLNEQLFRSTPAAKYATMFLGFYDGHRKRLTYSNAGHLPPFLVCADGSYRKLGDGGMVVGLFGGVSYENEHVELCSGDIIVAYSDGVTEPENEFGEFGEERLAQIVRENSLLPLPRIAEAVITAVIDWIGGTEQPDDITVVLARAR